MQTVLNSLSKDTSIVNSFESAGKILANALLHKKKILIAGNGGSAAEAQHFAAEIVGRYKKERQGYPAISLNSDISIMTAVSNDYGFEKVFSRQIEALGEEGDVLITLSTSGNSSNIISAIKAAKKTNLKTIALSGKGGGLTRNLSDIDIIIPSNDTARIQEIHLLLIHAWCEIIDENVI